MKNQSEDFPNNSKNTFKIISEYVSLFLSSDLDLAHIEQNHSGIIAIWNITLIWKTM